jgi:PEP-CTERM motif
MKKTLFSNTFPPVRFLTCASALALGSAAQAQITGNLGTSSINYGSALAVQTINTGFGDSTGAGGGDDLNGSELDAGYGVVSGGNLYLFLAGDVQGGTSPNSLQIFIGGGGSTVGQSTLSTTISPLSNMNGSTFASGFSATLAFTLNDYSGTLYTDGANLQTGGGTGGYVGAVTLSGGIGSGAPAGGSYSLPGFQEAFNNTQVGTMGASGTALSGSSSGANTTTGLELLIPLADLGTISGNIEVMADIDNGGLNYLSNQFLTGLSVGSGNLGTSTFSNAGYFIVPVPEPSTWALSGISGLSMLMMFRRRK